MAVQTEVAAREERGRQAETYTRHPAHLRLEELAALRDLARNANARLYLDFNGKPPPDDAKGG